jgi:phosphomannomutase/phosphoglucomutase
MGIFRSYDIRGVYGEELDETLFGHIGHHFSNFIDNGELAVGHDARLSSPSLKDAFVKRASAAGSDVFDLGMVPTPLLYFAVAHYNRAGGAMITASHNPAHYNGAKLVGKRGVAFSYETGIGEIEKAIINNGNNSKRVAGNGGGSISGHDILGDYSRWVLGKTRIERPLKVVVDAGNGVSGELAPEILERAGCEVTKLFCDIDGRFPNHHPDPSKDANLKWLIEKVKKEKADFGIALDGDGDRAAFVDEKGAILRGDVSLGIFAHELLKRKSGATVIYEVKCSTGLIEMLAQDGARGFMSRIGHTHIQNMMIKENADLGGELSGHFHFAENYGFDDGIYAALKMAETISMSGKLSALAQQVPKYIATPEYRLPYPDDKKFAVIDEISKSLQARYGEKAIMIDGIRLELPSAWGGVRASNTEPALSARFEGKTKKDLEEVRKIFERELSNFDISLPKE